VFHEEHGRAMAVLALSSSTSPKMAVRTRHAPSLRETDASALDGTTGSPRSGPTSSAAWAIRSFLGHETRPDLVRSTGELNQMGEDFPTNVAPWVMPDPARLCASCRRTGSDSRRWIPNGNGATIESEEPA